MAIKVLLTGASGFVGGRFMKDQGQHFEIQTVDLRKSTPESLDMSGIHSIVHCAALVHQMQGAPEEKYFDINTELTRRLAQRAKDQGVKQFIFLSTAHVFGDSGTLKNPAPSLNEGTPCHPKDAYGRSKLEAEKNLLEMKSENFVVTIIRPPMVYGKGAKGNLLALAKLVRVAPFLPLKYTLNQRSVIYVGNLCHFIGLAIQAKKSGIFLPQDPQPLSIAELVDGIAKAMDKKTHLFALPFFFYRILFNAVPSISLRLFGSLALDSKGSNTALNYKAPYSTQEGLRDMFSQ
ncbi:NAD-dependent epimerase/dehydratase family protein [Bdellovibrio sp. HCB337]|uniref:NAD-dependent epimerase/dehydratase family protein n=1 Tax=Bdellovibrio sp. HCB337 TaxID=3394358 RepID=UPI0039A44737